MGLNRYTKYAMIITVQFSACSSIYQQQLELDAKQIESSSKSPIPCQLLQHNKKLHFRLDHAKSENHCFRKHCPQSTSKGIKNNENIQRLLRNRRRLQVYRYGLYMCRDSFKSMQFLYMQIYSNRARKQNVEGCHSHH